MAKHKYTISQLEKAVKDSNSMRQVLNKLGLVEAGGNYTTVAQLIRAQKIDICHFSGKGWRKGSTSPVVKPTPLENILVKNSAYQSAKLKKRLVSAGIKLEKCENCDLTQWLGNKIPLELHHSNADKTDNRLENLIVLCPNCHSFTDNYRGKALRKCRDLTGTTLIGKGEDKVQTTNRKSSESYSGK
jgi:Zn finger protein HypA/HybF involved in hydrogenase expression